MVCPICTLAVAGGVGLLRTVGIDDVITGLWYGALIVSSIVWFIDYLNRKSIQFLFRKILVIAVFYTAFIWPLYRWNIMGKPENIIFGVSWLDRILFGAIIGTFIFIFAILSDIYLRKINENKPIIKYQKVLIPLVFLTIASIIIHLLIKIFGW